jgi:hypothetical protein
VSLITHARIAVRSSNIERLLIMLRELPLLGESYQCPGCMLGSNTKCGAYTPANKHDNAACMKHAPGTTIFPVIGSLLLGLPKGFNRILKSDRKEEYVRIIPVGTKLGYDHLNVPVWCMEHGCNLVVRTYSPRIDRTMIDVLEGMTLESFQKEHPNVINVAKFIDDID